MGIIIGLFVGTRSRAPTKLEIEDRVRRQKSGEKQRISEGNMEIIANHFGLGSSIYVLNARQMITERREVKNVDDVEFVN